MAQYVYTMMGVGKIVPPKREILKNISLSFFPGAKIGVLGAFGLPYRSDKDLMAWIANDPLPKFRNTLVAIGTLTQKQADEMEADVKKQVAESIEFARNSPKPQQDRGLSNVYAQGSVSPSQMYA